MFKLPCLFMSAQNTIKQLTKPILSSCNITLQWTEVLLLMFWPFQGPALGQNSIQRNVKFFSIYTHEENLYFLKSNFGNNTKIPHVEWTLLLCPQYWNFLVALDFPQTLGCSQEHGWYISPLDFQGDCLVILLI